MSVISIGTFSDPENNDIATVDRPLAISPETLGKLIEIAPQTLSDWRKSGEGPAWFKLGRLVRYRVDAVEAWLREREADS